MSMRKGLVGIALAAAAVSSAFAQTKISAHTPQVPAPAQAQEIVVGHVSGYTGPVMKDAIEMGMGAQVLFDAVN